MSTTVYEGTVNGQIWTNEAIERQLERALAELRDNESNSIKIELAGIEIEIDRNDSSLSVIA